MLPPARSSPQARKPTPKRPLQQEQCATLKLEREEITEDSERCELRRLFENIFLELALNCSYVRDRIPLFIGEACRP